MVRTLLEQGADPNSASAKLPPNTERRTPSPTIMEVLKGHHTDSQSGGESALMIAISTGHRDVVAELLNRGSNVNYSDDYGMTALHYAVFNRDESLVETLFAHGARPDAVDRRGRTPLMAAIAWGYSSFIHPLIRHGANTNTVDYEGNTPLILAAKLGRPECVSILLENGAGLNKTDRQGLTALAWAVKLMSSVQVQKYSNTSEPLISLLLWKRTNEATRKTGKADLSEVVSKLKEDYRTIVVALKSKGAAL